LLTGADRLDRLVRKVEFDLGRQSRDLPELRVVASERPQTQDQHDRQNRQSVRPFGNVLSPPFRLWVGLVRTAISRLPLRLTSLPVECQKREPPTSLSRFVRQCPCPRNGTTEASGRLVAS